MESDGQSPYDLTDVARTTLTEADIDNLRVGTWILGTGGGGDPYFGYLCLKKLYAQGRLVQVIDPMDLPDDAFVAAVNQMGSPMPAEERLTDPATVTRAIREMETYADIRFAAVMPWEIGGGNAFQPLMAAAMMGLPVVDADAMGRAFPEAQMTSFAVKDFTCHPLVMADIRPNTVIISQAADWKWLERIRRRVCTELGAIAATCNPPRTGHEVKTGSHLHTVSKALRIGRTVRRAQAEHRPGVARAERAHDDVVHGGRAFQHNNLRALRAAKAKLGDGLRAVLQQPSLVLRIDPGPGHHLGAVHWPNVVLVRSHDLVDGVGGHVALFDQQRLERPGAQRRV